MGRDVEEGEVIAIVGIDGAGKSTLAQALVDRLNGLGMPTILVHEPQNRDWVKPDLDPLARLFGMLADHIQVQETVIKPAINAGTHVVLDRYAPICARVYNREAAIKHWDRKGWEPQIAALDDGTSFAVLLDIDPKVAQERLIRRAEDPASSFTAVPTLSQLERWRARYLDIFEDGYDYALVERPYYVAGHQDRKAWSDAAILNGDTWSYGQNADTLLSILAWSGLRYTDLGKKLQDVKDLTATCPV